MGKTTVLEKILTYREITDFSRRWIEKSRTDEATIGRTYEVLKRVGFLVRAPQEPLPTLVGR